MGTSPRWPAVRRGYTLFELLLSLTILGILAAMVVLPRQLAHRQAVDDAAFLVRASFQQAALQAVGRGEDAWLTGADASDGAARAQGQAVTVPIGGDTTGVAGAWFALPAGIRWSPGLAQVGPVGDSTATWHLPRVQCTTAGTCVPPDGADVAVFYVSVAATPTAVRAVSVTAAGDFRIFRYDPQTGRWQ